MGIYLDRWSNYDEMKEEWLRGPYNYETREYEFQAVDFPPKESIIVALYTGGFYEGYAFVLFEQDGKLYTVDGSHCSCYGLNEGDYSGGTETQWKPEETTMDALRMLDHWSWGGYADQVKGIIANLDTTQPDDPGASERGGSE